MLVGVVGDFFLERGLPTETGQETRNAKQNILIIVYYVLSWVVCFYKLLIPDIMKYITLTYDLIFYIYELCILFIQHSGSVSSYYSSLSQLSFQT